MSSSVISAVQALLLVAARYAAKTAWGTLGWAFSSQVGYCCPAQDQSRKTFSRCVARNSAFGANFFGRLISRPSCRANSPSSASFGR